MKPFLQKLWPDRLFGQILLVVGSALFVAQAINGALLLSGIRARASAEAATMIVGRVVNQIEKQNDITNSMNTAQRQKQVNRVKRDRAPAITFTVDDDPLKLLGFNYESDLSKRATQYFEQAGVGIDYAQLSTGPFSRLPPKLVDRLKHSNYLVRLRRLKQPMPDTAILLSARTKEGKWINSATALRPRDKGATFALFLQTITLYIAVLVPLALVTRRIVKPLERLTSKVQRVGIAGDADQLKSEGPKDIRQLIDSFNAMQSRVAALLGEKDVMLGAISHDLKTPLAALRVRIESVDDEIEREKMAATVDEMVVILDDILILARLGKSGEALQKTDLILLVQSVAEEFLDAGADLELPPAPQRIIANIRPVLIRRALRNIIGNALHYGYKATLSVTEHTGSAAIIVDDIGPGIAGEDIENMFEPFVRAETSRNRTTGGSGLGLTIARAIIRSHNGDIIVANRDEGGLRVRVEFPI